MLWVRSNPSTGGVEAGEGAFALQWPWCVRPRREAEPAACPSPESVDFDMRCVVEGVDVANLT